MVRCSAHNFAFVADLANQSSPFFKAVGALAVHEPLRNAESVPANALATGKPIWSSEAYTTYSDSNGGGCWARALNWGYVKGNVTSHIAWNLIQSYPSTGGGMDYTGYNDLDRFLRIPQLGPTLHALCAALYLFPC